MKLRSTPLITLTTVVIFLLVIPTFLPVAVVLNDVDVTPNLVNYITKNPSFETGVSGWEIEGNVTREAIGYLSNKSISFYGNVSLSLQEPTRYITLNGSIVLTIALKDVKSVGSRGFIEIDTLAFWSDKRIVPIHVILGHNLTEENRTVTAVDGSGVYVLRNLESSSDWKEYRLQLGSMELRKLIIEQLREYQNESLARIDDELKVRFLFVKIVGLKGYLDRVGIGRLLPSLVTLHFSSCSLIPMSLFVQKLESNGLEVPYEVTTGYYFSITYVEPRILPAHEEMNVTVYFSTGQRVSAEIVVRQGNVVWI